MLTAGIFPVELAHFLSCFYRKDVPVSFEIYLTSYLLSSAVSAT
jgi:hypothetical protein